MIRVNLLPESERRQRLPLQRIFSLITIAFLFLFACIYGLGVYRVASLEQDLSAVHERQQLLQQSIARKEKAEAKQREIQARTAVLADLSRNRQSMHAVMVHLGSLTAPNVWLKTIAFAEGNVVSIQGNAASFAYLSAFLKKFEDDTLLTNVILKNSSTEKIAGQDAVKFEVTANFKGL